MSVFKAGLYRPIVSKISASEIKPAFWILLNPTWLSYSSCYVLNMNSIHDENLVLHYHKIWCIDTEVTLTHTFTGIRTRRAIDVVFASIPNLLSLSIVSFYHLVHIHVIYLSISQKLKKNLRTSAESLLPTAISFLEFFFFLLLSPHFFFLLIFSPIFFFVFFLLLFCCVDQLWISLMLQRVNKLTNSNWFHA